MSLNEIENIQYNPDKKETILDLQISNNVGEEYVPLLNDVLRMVTLQIIIHLWFYF